MRRKLFFRLGLMVMAVIATETSAIASPCLTAIESERSDSTFCSIPSVSQLSGVKPDDWAFQALQSLAE